MSPGSSALDVRADGRDDAAAALRGLVGRHDQAARQLRLVDRLEDDVVVERLERHVGHGMPFQHGLHDTRCMRLGRYDVPVTNPDKLFFAEPGLTKGDLVAYYVAVADCALPHLRRRPFHMKRFPNGVDADFFHQKRVPANHPEYVDEIFVQFPSGHSTVFAIVDNAAALAWVANLGCIELHTWHSRVPEIERPDYLLIDLDPTTDGQWPFVREIALVVKEVLDELGLRSYPKTSGATGLHILAPIRPEVLFPDVRRLAKAIAVGGRAAGRRPGGRDDDVEGGRPRRRLRRLRPERARPHDRLGVLGAPDARRARLGAAPVGRGRDRRAGGVHAADDAGADRRRRRPDARHVAQPTVPAPPLREARPARATRLAERDRS